MRKAAILPLGLSAGYILTFFSEFSFYGQLSEPGLPSPTAVDLLLLCLVYSSMALLILSLIEHFRVRSLAALFISGAAYGWMLEGMVVATVYEAMPFSISFTALAWHAPLDVLIGLYFLPRWLQTSPPGRNALRFTGMGVLWGIWILWPWYELRAGLLPESFLVFGIITTLLLICAYWVLGNLGLKSFRPPRQIALGIGTLLLISFFSTALPSNPLAGLILPLLLGGCWWALERNRRLERGESILAEISPKPLPLNLFCLLLLPVSAYITYRLFLSMGWRLPSNVLLGLVSSLGGTALLAASFWKVARQKPGPVGPERA